MKVFTKIRRWLEGLPLVGNLFYWIRANTYNKYHLIDIRNVDPLFSNYKWGWIDRDHAMRLAIWKLFIDYYEKESPQIGWQLEEHSSEIKKEMDELYKYWKVDRPEKYKQLELLQDLHNIRFPFPEPIPVLDTDGSPKYYKIPASTDEAYENNLTLYKMEKELEEEEDLNLIRILKIYRAFWS